MGVCEVMDASAACCGVGNNVDDVGVDVEPRLGEDGIPLQHITDRGTYLGKASLSLFLLLCFQSLSILP
jgi:hypothetical protein